MRSGSASGRLARGHPRQGDVDLATAQAVEHESDVIEIFVERVEQLRACRRALPSSRRDSMRCASWPRRIAPAMRALPLNVCSVRRSARRRSRRRSGVRRHARSCSPACGNSSAASSRKIGSTCGSTSSRMPASGSSLRVRQLDFDRLGTRRRRMMRGLTASARHRLDRRNGRASAARRPQRAALRLSLGCSDRTSAPMIASSSATRFGAASARTSSSSRCVAFASRDVARAMNGRGAP